MTRFARAKGSKSSNLKTPEDSTPWEVMKEQLLKSKKENEESKNREEAERQRIENYNNFLKEQKTQKRKAEWCDFPETQDNNKTNLSSNYTENKKKKLTSYNSVNNSKELNGDQKVNKVLKKKNKKKKLNNNEKVTESSPVELNVNNHQEKTVVTIEQNQNLDQIVQTPSQKKKKKNQKQTTVMKANPASDISIENSNEEVNTAELVQNQKPDIKKKKKNKKQKKINDNTENIERDKQLNNAEQKVSVADQVTPSKKKKDKQNRRKPINDKSFRLIINSKEVQLVRFDGFPIMKKDADRLEELKKNMIQKGIPKSEVQRTMKLERRRAEKALARLKRDVCYNCRKGGHNLSDCPDLKSNIPGTGAVDGMCFKCGSTEHRQFECKVQKDKEFRFATCFICKESGHIARQCPDNPKGLYPNGGCCKLCGDVTHLRKDCPTVNEKKESTSIKLQTLTGDNIEDIGRNDKQVSEEPVSKKPKKIKF